MPGSDDGGGMVEVAQREAALDVSTLPVVARVDLSAGPSGTGRGDAQRVCRTGRCDGDRPGVAAGDVPRLADDDGACAVDRRVARVAEPAEVLAQAAGERVRRELAEPGGELP